VPIVSTGSTSARTKGGASRPCRNADAAFPSLARNSCYSRASRRFARSVGVGAQEHAVEQWHKNLEGVLCSAPRSNQAPVYIGVRHAMLLCDDLVTNSGCARRRGAGSIRQSFVLNVGAGMDDHDDGWGTCSTRVSVRLLGGFDLAVGGRQLKLPLSAQRVLAVLALRSNEQDRTVLGTMLYPDGRRSRISASLRSALWRAKREVGQALVESQGQRLRLAEGVDVDLHRWSRRARTLMSHSRSEPATEENDLVEALSQELLPSWGDEWLVLDRHRWDQLRLHALECLAERFAAAGRYMDALEAGLAAVSIEPFRESAHRVLIKAFIAEGNSASAMAQYRRYQRVVRPATRRRMAE
jgi:DNA-binding SARP family transcriptional activator